MTAALGLLWGIGVGLAYYSLLRRIRPRHFLIATLGSMARLAVVGLGIWVAFRRPELFDWRWALGGLAAVECAILTSVLPRAQP